MKFRKLGRIFKPGFAPWAVSHGQAPFVEYLDGDKIRIYFTPRDKKNRSHAAFLVIDMKNPYEILEITDRPLLEPGELGCFDDCGAMPSCLVNYGDKRYLYYTGWSRAVTTPFTFFIGLAISEDGGKTYRRYSKAPVLGRNINDPLLTCSPWVIIEDGLWKMWYVSGTKWLEEREGNTLKHYYHICYAESKNGIEWKTGTVCIDFKDEEYAIARPVVLKEDGEYRMWYCYRGGSNTYRAGFATSDDGIAWRRRDLEVELDVSDNPDDWDSEMICYPCKFTHGGKNYLLYNGNRYGKTGFGLAIFEEE